MTGWLYVHIIAEVEGKIFSIVGGWLVSSMPPRPVGGRNGHSEVTTPVGGCFIGDNNLLEGRLTGSLSCQRLVGWLTGHG